MTLSRAAALAILLVAMPGAAQNTIAPTPAPAPRIEPAPVPAPAKPAGNAVAPQPEVPAAPAPAPQQPSMQTLPIQPDAQYPNGFQDPANPFANEYQAYREEQQGFPWGLLGLLGLLGLIPLIRGNGARTVYVERDEPRRVLRERGEDERP